MSVASIDQGDVTGGHVKIGAASHWGRNLAIAVGAVLLAVGSLGLSIYSNREDAATLNGLEAFRSAFADKCDVEYFRGEASSVVKDTYLRSEPLREAIAKQQQALQSGASCEEIARAHKAADYPFPVLSP